MTVVGCDLSTRALDLVKLDDDTNRAEWVRCELVGADAWERTLNVRRSLSGWHPARDPLARALWWDDVHLVAIELPFGRLEPGTQAKLNHVVGAVAASLPAHLRNPDRCWIVRPDEWKAGLGLKGKPAMADLARIAGETWPFTGSPFREPLDQNARDAYCLALFARGELERGVQEAV